MSSSAEKSHSVVPASFTFTVQDKDGLAPLECDVTIDGTCTGGPVGHRQIINIRERHTPFASDYHKKIPPTPGSSDKERHFVATAEIISVYAVPVGDCYYDPESKKTTQKVRVTWTAEVEDYHELGVGATGYLHTFTQDSSQNGMSDPVLVCG